MKALFKTFIATTQDEDGATVVEYAVVLTLIAAVIIFSVSLVGEETRDAYEKVNNVLIEVGIDEGKCKGKDSEDDDDCGIGND